MATVYSKEMAERYAEIIIADELSLKPVILSIVGDVKNKNVLDLGCGNGKYSMIFAKRGAYVKGIDKSRYQIEIARKRNKHQKIEYSIVDGSNMSEIKRGSIDLVFMNLVISDIENKKRLVKVFSEVSRVLKPEGKFILSNLHPLYLSAGQDSLDKPIDFKKENYFNEGHIYRAEAVTKKHNKIVFNESHFSLSYLSKVFRSNGFVIRQIYESKSVPKKGIYLPKYIVFELAKVK